jgi:arsenate reductase-like glutaredoxin family protein
VNQHSNKVLEKIFQKAKQHSEFSNGKERISPKEIKKIITYTLMHIDHKKGIQKVSKEELNNTVKELENNGKIEFIAVHTIVLNSKIN